MGKEKTRILIVEDERLIAEDLKDTIDKIGYEVTAITGFGEEAVKIAEKKLPDLVLMDIVLKGKMDGIEAAEKIHSKFKIPIVYITAYAEDKILEQAKITEPYGYIIKPFEERELRSAIEIALYKSLAEKKIRISKEEWEATFNAISDWVCLIDLDGKILRCNEAGEELTGIPFKDMAGQTCCKLVHDSDKHLPECPMTKMLKSKKKESAEIQVPNINRWFLVTIDPVFNADGKLEKAVHITRDITERKRVEEQLARERTLVETVNAMEDAVLVFDVDGVCIYANPHYFKMFGLKKKDYIGKSIMEISGIEMQKPKEIEKFMGLFAKAIENGKAGPVDLNLVALDGKEIPVNVAGGVIRNSEGESTHVIAVVRDITERKQMETELKSHRDHLEELVKERTFELKESEDKFRTIFEHANDLIVYVNTNGEIVETNNKIENILGFKREEIIGKKFTDLGLVTSKYDAMISKLFHQTVRDGEKDSKKIDDFNIIDFEVKNKQGNPVFLEASTTHLRKDEEFIGFLSVIRDISERKAAEEALRESEEKYRMLFDNLNVGVYRVTPGKDGKFIDVNPAFVKILGYKDKEEILKLNVSDIYLEPNKRSKFNKKIVKEDQIKNEELYLKKKDGSLVIISDTGNVIRNKKGEILFFDGIIEDITERKAAEDALLESEKRLKEAQKMGRIGDWEFDVKSNKIYWSEQVFQLFHRDPKQGPPNYDENMSYYHPEDLKRLQKHVQRAIENGESIISDYRVKLPSGKSVYHASTINPITDTAGQVTKLVGTVQDITERKNAEEELQRYREHLEELVEQRTKQLEETNAELEAFAFSVSHDLRAPLRAMQGFAQILLDDYGNKLDADGKEYTNRIINASQQLNTMIENLLAYSRLSRSEMKLRSMNLQKIVNNVIDQFKPKIKEIKAEVNVKKYLPEVLANNATLMQIISNLILNALIFTKPNTKPKIKIWAQEHENRIKLFIEDNGIGIAPEYQDKIFNIFERLHGIEAYPGTGIGLAIVKKGVERMDGRLGVESSIGKGSKFWIELTKAGGKIEK